MNLQRSSRRERALALGAAGALLAGLTGCQQTGSTTSPDTHFSGAIDDHLIGALVNPVGPTKWCYTVESYDKIFTNAPGYGQSAPYPGSPDGHPTLGSFTNVAVSASGCKATVSTAGWDITAGSSFTFTTGTNKGTSQVQFCLECDKTNGEINIEVTDSSGNKATLGPIAGPK